MGDDVTIALFEWSSERIPGWLRDEWGEAWQRGIALVAHESLARGAIAALLARLPGRAPDDALPLIGDDRGIERGLNETRFSYVTRLRRAFAAWRAAGTSAGVQRELRAAGFLSALVIEAKDRFPGIEPWARFWVEIRDPSLVNATWSWGDGTRWGTGAVWGGVNPAAHDLIQRIVRRWKGPHTRCEAVSIIVTEPVWGSGWHWGDGTLWGGRRLTFGV